MAMHHDQLPGQNRALPPEPDAMGYLAVSRQENDWNAEKQRTIEAFSTRVDALIEVAPSVEQDRELIEAGGARLIETFQVRPEFFDEPMRSTIFSSLALIESRAQQAMSKSNANDESIQYQSFAHNAAFLLTRNYADANPELVADYERQRLDGRDDKNMKAMLDRFEQPEVTRDLTAFIERKGILDKLKAYFGNGQEHMPEYHVLAIGRNPNIYFDRDAAGLTREEAVAWERGLEKLTAEFAEKIPEGEYAANASGFAVDFSSDPGVHHVYIPMLSAELVMAEERGIVPSEYMVRKNRAQSVVSTIKHEFVHTQDEVGVEVEFGKSLEERRAEWFSGDGSEYFEVKAFFRQLHVLFGRHIGDMFEESVESKRNHPVNIYELIARDYGLDMVAEIAASQPDVYVRSAKSKFTHDMLDSLGGFDAIVERAAKNPQTDRETARMRAVKVINSLRTNKVGPEGELDKEHEEFLGSYFGPLLRGLGMHLTDIPYEPTIEE